MDDRGGRRRRRRDGDFDDYYMDRPDRAPGANSYSSPGIREPAGRSDSRRQGDERRMYALEDYSSGGLRSGSGDSRVTGGSGFEGPGSGMFPNSAKNSNDNNFYTGYSLVKGEEDNIRNFDSKDDSSDPTANFTAADKEFMEQWLEAADNGELDIYTCLALSDMSTWSTDTRDLVLYIICVLVVQGVIPFIMLRTELRNEKDDELPDIEYRMCGFIIYLYSVWMIYKGSTDDCRTLVVDRGIQCGVPMHFLMPAVFGEVMNAIVGCALTTSLFVIFTSSSDMTNLVMNAVAINFLATVDSEFVELSHKKLAKQNLNVITEGWPKYEGSWRRILTSTIQVVLEILRICGILILGCVFAIIFFCTHEPWLCDRWNMSHFLAPIGMCDIEDPDAEIAASAPLGVTAAHLAVTAAVTTAAASTTVANTTVASTTAAVKAAASTLASTLTAITTTAAATTAVATFAPGNIVNTVAGAPPTLAPAGVNTVAAAPPAVAPPAVNTVAAAPPAVAPPAVNTVAGAPPAVAPPAVNTVAGAPATLAAAPVNNIAGAPPAFTPAQISTQASSRRMTAPGAPVTTADAAEEHGEAPKWLQKPETTQRRPGS